MSSSCSHHCESCTANCGSRKEKDFSVPLAQKSHIKKVIGIVSGKGGVGKSMVSMALAVLMQRKGNQCGILDGDITGPSIPKGFGLREKLLTKDGLMVPAKTKTGIDVVSTNLILDDETAPVIWRGPMISGVVQQFWKDVLWENEDYLFIDMPPGTGDVPLTVFQSLPVDGIVVVSSPQGLVEMIVQKAISMAKKMQVPILGLVENMSYFTCPDCGAQYEIFGKSSAEELAAAEGIDVVCRLPILPQMAQLTDEGRLEELPAAWEDALSPLTDVLEKM